MFRLRSFARVAVRCMSESSGPSGGVTLYPKVFTKISKLLHDNGHSCVRVIDGKYRPTLHWCQRDKCWESTVHEQELMQNNMRKRNDKAMRLVHELEARNHTCIQIKECYPMHVSWCQKEPCSNTGK